MALKPPSAAGFDAYALNYDTTLNRGLAVSGEDRQFFARGRVAWLARCLRGKSFAPRLVLDFGCGTGSAIPFFYQLLPARSAIGLDTSAESLAVARHSLPPPRTRLLLCADYQPEMKVDLVFSNGVFHHIPPADRLECVRFIFRSLRPGGLFALWENNPWNPGTRYVMSRIPFDRDAVMLSAGQARSLLKEGGFEIVQTDFCFIFPRTLKLLRFVEPALARLPLGAQYQVLARKR